MVHNIYFTVQERDNGGWWLVSILCKVSVIAAKITHKFTVRGYKFFLHKLSFCYIFQTSIFQRAYRFLCYNVSNFPQHLQKLFHATTNKLTQIQALLSSKVQQTCALIKAETDWWTRWLTIRTRMTSLCMWIIICWISTFCTTYHTHTHTHTRAHKHTVIRTSINNYNGYITSLIA